MKTKNGSRFSVKSGLELIVIFVGVTSAFFVENFRAELEDRKRLEQITAVLERELHTYVDRVPYVVEDMDARLSQWDQEFEAGDRPVPAYYRESAAETPPTAVWQATIASGGVNLLAADLFYDLAFYYHRLESVSQRYIRYSVFTEREILPRIKLGSDAFYTLGDGDIDPQFRSHMEQLREIGGELAELGRIGQGLIDRIEET